MDPKQEQKFWRMQVRTWTFLSWIYGILARADTSAHRGRDYRFPGRPV
jgi:hypothetical protein